MNSKRDTQANPAPISIKQVFLFASFASFFVVLLVPFDILFSNLNEFSLTTTDFLKIFVPAWIASIFALLALVYVLPARTRHIYAALLVCLGTTFWLQSSFLAWNYGPFDGSDIDWSAYRSNGFIDTPVWLIVIGLGLRYPKQLIRIGAPIAMLLIALQLITVVSQATSIDSENGEGEKRHFAIDYSSKYHFSSERNVILIVLDAFQGDIFYEIISEEPEYAEFFIGFTYFRNAIAGGNYTELAIPAILTGQTYDNTVPRDVFLKDSYRKHGISTILKKSGFHAELFPWIGWGNESIFFEEAIASNFRQINAKTRVGPTFTEKKAKEALHLLDLSIFRSVPHVLKRYVHNEHKWFVTYIATYLVPDEIKTTVATDNQFEIATFIKQAPDRFPADRNDPVFKYYHLKGAHAPLTVSEDLEFTTDVLPFSKQAYVYQAKANLLALKEFFFRLKISGVFDNSMILVLGDHGSGGSPDLYIVPEGASRDPMRLDGSPRNFRRDKARAIPLVLIKPLNASGALKTSVAPVATTDTPATILAELEVDEQSPSISMFDIQEDDPRIRYHGAFDYSPNKGDYVADITLYKVSGDSWADESWEVDAVMRPAPKIPAASIE
jgi:hypothetical protein